MFKAKPISLITPLDFDECMDRLNREVYQGKLFALQYSLQPVRSMIEPFVAGIVSRGGRIQLRRIGYYRTSWNPILFYGWVRSDEQGTLVRGHFGSPLSFMLFHLLWVVLWGCATVYTTLRQLVAVEDGGWLGIAIMWIVLAKTYFFFKLSQKRWSKIDEKFILQFLKETLEIPDDKDEG